jgi:hypothetical protein
MKACITGPVMKRRTVAWASALALALALAGVGASLPLATAQEVSDQDVLKALTTEHPRDRAARRGLEYLRRAQGPEGLFGDKFPVAVSGLAVMAHFAASHILEDAKYGPALRRAVETVLTRQDENGYFGRSDDSNMYGHGITTLMLAEAIGMTRDNELEDKLRHALERAVRVTVNAARIHKQAGHEGGWRYQPDQADSDLSLSGWQLLSLHAAQQVAIPVPEEVPKAAVAYAKRLTTPEGRVGYSSRGEDRPALRGLALLCFAIGREEGGPAARAVTARILSDPIKWEGEYFFYRAYYDAVGLARAAPEAWTTYAPKLEDLLIQRQKADGSWDSPGGEVARAGPAYVTSMAVLALTVQRHVLPAYQR